MIKSSKINTVVCDKVILFFTEKDIENAQLNNDDIINILNAVSEKEDQEKIIFILSTQLMVLRNIQALQFLLLLLSIVACRL